MENYDVAVIGSGPAGYAAAVRSAQLGSRVALIESGASGGTCLNRGCIPTKALLESARVADEIASAGGFGVKVSGYSLDFPAAMRRKDEIVGKLRAGLETVFSSHGVTLLKGFARFVGQRELELRADSGEVSRISFAKAIVASGASPKTLPNLAPDGKKVLASKHILEIKSVPESLFVAGAGYLGVELATIFSCFGARVTLAEAQPQILPGEDTEIAGTLARLLKGRGIEVRTGEAIDAPPAGFEKILLATGRVSSCAGMDVEKAGLKPEGGRIKVNARMETSVPGIYAAGDVTGPPMLAYKAADEGIVAAENACGAGEGPEMDYSIIPRCIFSFPEVACVGLTEAQATEKGLNVRVGRFPFAALGKAMAMGKPAGMVKMVIEADRGGILGVHIVGAKATELISQAALLLKMEATTEEVSRLLFPHPTLGEALHGAAMAAEGRSTDLPRIG